MTMIERVARAMAERSNGGDFSDGRWYAEEHRKLWRERARAAIEALREPTESMVAAVDAAEEKVCCLAAYERLGFENAWPAAIDAALAETD
jgi:hypothetical protein